jgi:hypothetical protein
MKETEPRRVKKMDECEEREGHRHGPDMPDPKDIAELMETISDKIPDLLTKLGDVLYGTEQARKFGAAAAVFYKELKGTGMTDAQIFELTRQYMSTLNIGGMIGEMRRKGEEQGK